MPANIRKTPASTSPDDVAKIEASLRPCPFCGPLPAMPELVRSDVSGRWQVYCGPCGSSSGSCRMPDEAAAHWNSRHVEGPELGTSSAARTTVALWLSNSLADLAPSQEPPRFGFASPDRQARAYVLAGMILSHVNHRLLGRDRPVRQDQHDASGA